MLQEQFVPTATVEDYLERIHDLITAKGYARPVDIAGSMSVQQPSVTKMLQRMHEQGYIVYEKYRGLVLTPEGQRVAESVKFRHATLMRFLNLLGLDGQQTFTDVEGIEHHVSTDTIESAVGICPIPGRAPRNPPCIPQDTHGPRLVALGRCRENRITQQ